MAATHTPEHQYLLYLHCPVPILTQCNALKKHLLYKLWLELLKLRYTYRYVKVHSSATFLIVQLATVSLKISSAASLQLKVTLTALAERNKQRPHTNKCNYFQMSVRTHIPKCPCWSLTWISKKALNCLVTTEWLMDGRWWWGISEWFPERPLYSGAQGLKRGMQLHYAAGEMHPRESFIDPRPLMLRAPPTTWA